MKHLIAILLTLVLAACGGGGSGPEPLRVYIFAGQSNMLGADALITPDGLQDLAMAGQQTPVDRSSRFTLGGAMSYPWGDIRGHNGTSFGEAALNGVPYKVHGPEVGFNRALGGDIAIIKFTDNYFALEAGRSAWVKPGSKWTAWQAFVDQQLATIGEPYVIAGVVWFQGIDDGILGRDKASYKADLRQVLADLRSRFGAVPVVLGRSVDSQAVGSDGMRPIREAQVEVASEPGNAWVDVDDLPLVDIHHLTAAGQLVAGQRFAAKMAR